MNNHLKVSIIIPTYNDSKHIVSAIESALSQSLKEMEIIVVDDGSTDNTKIILDQYIKLNKIIYIYKDNEGVGIARNSGILISKGIYLAFIDSDDEWIDKDKLKKQVEFLDNNSDYVLIGTGGIIVDENKKVVMNYDVPQSDTSIRKSILLKNPFIQSSIVVRKDVFYKTKLYSKEIKIQGGEDYLLWLELGLLGKLFNLTEPMIKYMIRDGNISYNNKNNILKNNINIITKYRKNYPNFKEAILFAYFKLIIYCILRLVKNKNLKNKFSIFLYKKYRKLNFTR